MSALSDTPAMMRTAGAMLPSVLHLARICAATLQSMRPELVADALRRSTDAAYYLDPTTMLSVGAHEDIARKQRLLDAAATFVRVVTEVEQEAAASARGAG